MLERYFEFIDRQYAFVLEFGLQCILFALVALPLVLLNRGLVKTFKRNVVGATFCLIFLFPIWIIWSFVELFTDEINQEIEKKKPTKLQYIGVFLLFCIYNTILSYISILILPLNITSHLADHLIAAVIVIYAFIFTYNIFNTLNVKKVFPYLVGACGLSTLVAIQGYYISYPDDGFASFYIYAIISFVLVIQSIRNYYVDKSKRWH